MASEVQIEAQQRSPVEVWPPDDSEESIVGTDLHQTTIINLRWGINEVARLHRARTQPVPWQALDQILMRGARRPDDSEYRTLPDVFVYRCPIDHSRGSVDIGVDGPPVLIIEVLSDATRAVDLDLERGKGYSYGRAGVNEYLALDPTGAFVPGGGRGWRLEHGVYRPWSRTPAARWRSSQIPVEIGLEGIWAAVYTLDGVRQLREGEVGEALARRDEALTRQEEEIATLRRHLDVLQGRDGSC